jgi:hypothetical protein
MRASKARGGSGKDGQVVNADITRGERKEAQMALRRYLRVFHATWRGTIHPQDCGIIDPRQAPSATKGGVALFTRRIAAHSARPSLLAGVSSGMLF